MRRVWWILCLSLTCGLSLIQAQTTGGDYEYKLLATNRTTTMEKEMNEAAAEGYRFREVASGETAFGGNETLVVMERPKGSNGKTQRYEYQLLATTKTSKMQQELQTAGDKGFEFRGNTVFKKLVGQEVVVILERNPAEMPQRWDYKLLATNRTSTMQKEMAGAAAEGYQFVGFAVGETFFGGTEVVTIMRRPRP